MNRNSRFPSFQRSTEKTKYYLVVNENQTGRRDILNISDWTIDAVTASIGRRLSTYEYRISARRQIGFYFWKVIVPLMLIVGSTILVFPALVEAVPAAFRMDRFSRAAFPAAFGLLILFVFTR